MGGQTHYSSTMLVDRELPPELLFVLWEKSVLLRGPTNDEILQKFWTEVLDEIEEYYHERQSRDPT